MYVQGRILTVDRKPIPNASIETWETDDQGLYDTQYSDRERADCRGRFQSDAEGGFKYRAVVPVSYPIPDDGPVGVFLNAMKRHPVRPAHLHIMVTVRDS